MSETEPKQETKLTPQQIKNSVPHCLRKSDPRFIQNPFSKRYILKKSPTHVRLVHSGVFLNMDSTEPIKVVIPPKVTPAIIHAPIKEALCETLVNIIDKNKNKFEDLSEKETNLLLRKLLTLKLTKKKKKKKKKKVIVVSSSDESSSDSDSD